MPKKVLVSEVITVTRKFRPYRRCLIWLESLLSWMSKENELEGLYGKPTSDRKEITVNDRDVKIISYSRLEVKVGTSLGSVFPLPTRFLFGFDT